MTLVWHDWFATSNAGVGSQKLMLRQNGLFRRQAFGNFRTLLRGVTEDPAMILWLSSADNTKWEPNENYARELMESSRSASIAATPSRTCASRRALTGFRYDWTDAGPVAFRFDPEWHDAGLKTIFGKRGRFDWEDACRLCLEHPRHRSFLVLKLWSYFIPTPPSASRRPPCSGCTCGAATSSRCWQPSSSTRPSTTAPAWSSRRLCSSPGCSVPRGAVSTPTPGRGSATWPASTSSSRRTWPAGTSRAGSTPRRSAAAGGSPTTPWSGSTDPDEDAGRAANAAKLVERAAAFWGADHHQADPDGLTTFARRALATADASWKEETYVLIQNALRQHRDLA